MVIFATLKKKKKKKKQKNKKKTPQFGCQLKIYNPSSLHSW
jgi:hypothetical protein